VAEQLPKDPLLSKMADLLKQATTEKSHYYVASVLRDAMTRIEQLQMPPSKVLAIADSAEGADTQAVLNALCRRIEGQRKHIAALERKLEESH
jgi:hypothetical protein